MLPGRPPLPTAETIDRNDVGPKLRSVESALPRRSPRIADSRGRQLSMAEKVAMLPESQRIEFLRELAPSAEDLRELEYAWDFWARPAQMEPPGDWRTWLIMSGRGFGKTKVGSEMVIKRAKAGIGPIGLVGQTKADVRDTMASLFESSIIKCSPPWFVPKLEITKRRLTWPNGVQAVMYSGDEPDQMRGPQHAFVWLDEFAKFKYPQETWDNVSLGLRVGRNPQAIITTTPRPIPVIKKLVDDPETTVTTGSTYDNIGNLPAGFIKTILSRYENTRLGAQEIYGDLMGDVEGALWTRDMLEQTRVSHVPPMYRIIVAVDPSVGGSAGGVGGNETGIIVAGIGEDDHCYILEDASVNSHKPDVWAEKVVSVYERYAADRVIAESNQGGEMVRHTLHTVEPNLPITMVHASKGKYTRAEPVSSLYSQGRVHHLGMFADLEDQLVSWVPGENSPDRLDALVWAVTEVMLRGYGGMDIQSVASLFNYL